MGKKKLNSYFMLYSKINLDVLRLKCKKQKYWNRGCPGGAVVKNPPLCRAHWFEPWSRKIPHAAEQLSPCATTTEAHAPGAHALQQREATGMRSPRTTTKSSPHLPQLEKAHVQQRRTDTAKNELKKKLLQY